MLSENEKTIIVIIAIAIFLIVVVGTIIANRPEKDRYTETYKYEEIEAPEPEEPEPEAVYRALYNSTWSLIDHIGNRYTGMKFTSSGNFAAEWEFPDGRRLWLSGDFTAIEEK